MSKKEIELPDNRRGQQTTYMIARQRSGTNVLRGALDTHPDIRTVNEIMDSTIIDKFEGITSFADYLSKGGDPHGMFFPYYRKQLLKRKDEFLPSKRAFDWATNLILDHIEQNHVVFDLKYNSLWNIHENWTAISPIPPVLKDAQRRQIRIFHLTRKNVLANMCSILASDKSHVYHIKKDSDKEYEKPKLKLNTNIIVERLDAYRYEEITVRKYFEDYDRYFECDYSELFDEDGNFDEGLFSRIAEFFGVDQNFELEPKLKKIGNKNIGDTIENLGAVRKVLEGTEYAWCLEQSG